MNPDDFTAREVGLLLDLVDNRIQTMVPVDRDDHKTAAVLAGLRRKLLRVNAAVNPVLTSEPASA